MKQRDLICLLNEVRVSVCQLSRGTEFQRAMTKALPPAPSPPPHTHGTVFALNDGGEKVGPSRAQAVSGGEVMKEISQV